MTTYLTGDPHGRFDRIVLFARTNGLTSADTIIVTGDASINYEGRESDHDCAIRQELASLPCTLFCIQGNHDMRPYAAGCYCREYWHGGLTYVEDGFPQIRFAEDGQVYDFDGTSVMVCGGAYSVDAPRRQREGLTWFADEQPSAQVKERVEAKLEELGWRVDVMLTHTCPYRHRPLEMMAKGIDQSGVDTSTEHWLDELEDRLDFDCWYCGHWHTDKHDGRFHFLFEDWEVLWPGNPAFEELRRAEADQPNRRNVHTAAVDLCVSEGLLRAHLELDEQMVRRSDGSQLVDEGRMGAFIYGWFVPPNMRDFQFRRCSDCDRWFHRSHLTAIPGEGGGVAGIYCRECGPARGADAYPVGV